MKKKILVIGDIFLDIFSYGSVERISPESHAPVFNLDHNKFMLGGAANVALNLKSLEADVTLIGKIGNDESGKKIKDILKNKQISFINLLAKNTIVKNRFVTNFGQILRVDKENFIKNSRLDYKKIKNAVKKNNYDGIYVSDYQKGIIDLEVNNIINKNKNCFVFCDPKNTNFEIFKGFDFVKPNLKYVNSFIKFDPDNKRSISYIRNLLKKYKISNCIITMGNKGSILINKNEIIYSSSNEVNFYDLSGAGDTFGSIFFKQFIDGNDFKEILKISNFGASKVITKKGTSVISNSELNLNKENKLFRFGKDNKKILEFLKKQDKSIGFTNGCFDILHAGHVEMLNFSKKKCGFLICAVNSDKSVRKIKDSDRPIINENMRAELLMQLNVIDMVIIFDDETPIKLIKLVKPNFLIKGSDYKKKDIVGYDFIKKNGGKVILANLKTGFSTTKIIKNYNEKSSNSR